MDFYYPNFQNDMWKIFGLCFFQDKNYFLNVENKTFQEQKIIISLLDNPKKRIEIANTLKVTSGSLNRPLNRLLDFDLIEYVNDKYQITDPIFSNWLRNSYDKNGIFPFRSI